MAPHLVCFLIDDFGINYLGDQHLNHLRTVLTTHYTITEDLEGKFVSSIYLRWKYTTLHSQRTCRLCIDGYITNLLLKYVHKAPAKTQLSSHRHREINYGSKDQLVTEEDTSPKINSDGIKCVQAIFGALL